VNKWLWAGIIVLLLCGSPLAWFFYRRRAESSVWHAAYLHQLALARAEGLPTTAAEFAATIPPAKPEENAAAFYQQLGGVRERVWPVDDQVTYHPGPASIAAAKSFLGKYSADVKLLDEAVKRPRAWFNRDWSQGYGVLFREYSPMKIGAGLILLRGSIAAAENRPQDAIGEVQKAFVIANHASEEPLLISHLVRDSIYANGFEHLADWSFVHHEQTAYAEALRAAIAKMPPPNLKQECSNDLYNLLSLVELSSTREGRKELGVKESYVPQGTNLITALLNQDEAKARLVKAERVYWAALGLPDSQKRTDALKKARWDARVWLTAFPTAAFLYNRLDMDDISFATSRRSQWLAWKQRYVAALRALGQNPIPKAIKTSDLVSLVDGKPLTYHFDGKQIEIVSRVNTDGKLVPLRIPPTRVLHPELLKKASAR